ncbi:hypothetical protein P152DRAFT_405092 [Eremomyces bilateralis CBS 781.70]|uniref:DUF4336 domain-containing protein n=1 Tax=Eremomyces bilateralis CBS 781.70 TaxID=1392243 RepID=A0A6G1FSC3_9PEZI|nr:uncharacterized protein P152DRAFT_405092 [Eremomyces bilateralis CBS 781.70]KAF1808620.1 hypothetical protein P152DRAFT_405092 [Eremomyces bilateralis CBS 781.70]
MSSKPNPSDPSETMVIRKLNDNIVTCSVPFLRFGHIKFGGRGTIVKMQSGALAVFSPTALTPEVKEMVDSMGEVKYITALDIEHHIFLGPWNRAYPQAKVLCPEGLPGKRAKQKNDDVPFSVVFRAVDKESITVDPEFDAEFEFEFVHSHANKEIVFNWKPGKTLIEADLLFNLPATEQFSKTGQSPTSGILTKLFTTLGHTSGAAKGQQRIVWHAMSAGDRPGFAKSMAKINAWDFDRIIPCHGDVIETDGKGIFQKIMAWHLQGKKV